jgi:uroporphyrinogen decarboxylase
MCLHQGAGKQERVMNDRERFLATMNYQDRDRAPICDFGFWPETLERWRGEGLPAWVMGGHETENTDKFFGMDQYQGGPQIHVGLYPFFERKVLEDRGDSELVQQIDGVRVLASKVMGSIPQHEGSLLVDRASWEEHYKWRLNPDDEERYPDWEEARKVWGDKDYAWPRTLMGGSLYGWIRDWMGVEGVSYLVHDDPALFEEMVVTVGDLIVQTHRRAFEHGAVIEGCFMWEDMCYNAGPLLSPEHFKRYLSPQYRRITEQLRRHGCEVIWVDCDGRIEDLIPLWMEAGVNCMFPIEVGTCDGDPVRYRKQFGKELRMMGGFDKRILAQPRAEIVKEIERLTPLVEEGGYIPFCDHRVPPDVSLENYLFYLETLRRVWGGGVNLKPMGELEKPVASR